MCLGNLGLLKGYPQFQLSPDAMTAALHGHPHPVPITHSFLSPMLAHVLSSICAFRPATFSTEVWEQAPHVIFVLFCNRNISSLLSLFLPFFSSCFPCT